MARITINGISIDPMKQAPALAAANLISADASKSNFILVQVTTPLTAAQRQQLADLGVEILEYVPEDTYVCRYLPEDLGPIRALLFVSWVNVYLHGFKVSPKLRPAAAANLRQGSPLVREKHHGVLNAASSPFTSQGYCGIARWRGRVCSIDGAPRFCLCVAARIRLNSRRLKAGANARVERGGIGSFRPH